MGIYQKVCYKVEDIFVKIIAKKQDSELVKQKVQDYRTEKEKAKNSKKQGKLIQGKPMKKAK
jgi:hypothetical protein